MKFLYYAITISFALVNVSVASVDKYFMEVIRTNEHIKRVKDAMLEPIRFIIALDNYSMEEVACMLAVPEFTERNLLKSVHGQKHVQAVLNSLTGIKAPEINKADFDWNVDLSFYGNKRREMIMIAIQELIRGLQSGEIQEFESFSLTCCLIGLFRSVKFPDSHALSATVDADENCSIATINGTTTIYKSFDGIIWQLNKDYSLYQPISDQFVNLDREM